MIEIQAETSNLEDAIADFAKLAKKDLHKITKKQAGILVGHIIALTPPGNKDGQSLTDSGGIDSEARKKGESRVADDIAKIFPTSKLAEDKIWGLINSGFKWQTADGTAEAVREFADSEADLRRIHKFARNPRTGRTRKIRGLTMAVTRKAILRQYIRQEIKKVGKLSSGFLTAARVLGTSARNTPQWIRRHGAGGGGVSVRNHSSKIGIQIWNTQTWFPGDMDRRVKAAIHRREYGLEQAMKAMIEREAKKAQAKMGR